MGILVTLVVLGAAYKLYEANEIGGSMIIGIIGVMFAMGYLVEGFNKTKEVVYKTGSNRRYGHD